MIKSPISGSEAEKVPIDDPRERFSEKERAERFDMDEGASLTPFTVRLTTTLSLRVGSETVRVRLSLPSKLVVGT